VREGGAICLCLVRGRRTCAAGVPSGMAETSLPPWRVLISSVHTTTAARACLSASRRCAARAFDSALPCSLHAGVLLEQRGCSASAAHTPFVYAASLSPLASAGLRRTACEGVAHRADWQRSGVSSRGVAWFMQAGRARSPLRAATSAALLRDGWRQRWRQTRFARNCRRHRAYILPTSWRRRGAGAAFAFLQRAGGMPSRALLTAAQKTIGHAG